MGLYQLYLGIIDQIGSIQLYLMLNSVVEQCSSVLFKYRLHSIVIYNCHLKIASIHIGFMPLFLGTIHLKIYSIQLDLSIIRLICT